MSFSKQPKNPVDQFEIHCFSVSDFDVVEHRYLYHVNTKWNALYPDGGNGADFEDSWARQLRAKAHNLERELAGVRKDADLAEKRASKGMKNG